MEEMVNIIKKINAIEQLKEGKEEGLEYIEENNKENRNVDNEKRLAELMQELDETKDVYRRKELTEAIEQLKSNMLEIEKESEAEPKVIRKGELGELVQELSETKDVYKRKELTEKIEKATENILEKLNEDLDKKIEETTSELKKTIEPKVAKREQNKDELYRLKNNRDMLSVHKNNDNTLAWQDTYNMIGEEMSYKLKENKQLSTEIKELEEKISDLEARRFEKIIKEIEEQQEKQTSTKPEIAPTEPVVEEAEPEEIVTEPVIEETAEPEETVTEPVAEEAEPEETITEPVVEEAEPEETITEPVVEEAEPEEIVTEPIVEEAEPEEIVTEPIAEETEPEETITEPVAEEAEPEETITEPVAEETEPTENSNNRLTIYPDKVEVDLPNNKFTLQLKKGLAFSEEEKNILNTLSDETIDKLNKVLNLSVNKNIKLDPVVLRGLLRDEQKLNNYLDLCVRYNDLGSDIVPTEVQEAFPEIVYNFKGIRKNKDMHTLTKLRMYKNAKDLEEMLTYYYMEDKVQIKIGLLDRVYLRIQDFISKRKNNVALLTDNNKEQEGSKRNDFKHRLTGYTKQFINEQETEYNKENDNQQVKTSSDNEERN